MLQLGSARPSSSRTSHPCRQTPRRRATRCAAAPGVVGSSSRVEVHRFLWTEDGLFGDASGGLASELREHFDARFAAPRATAGDALAGRFVWDYWHVPGQYAHMRTPAAEFFPAALGGALEDALLTWGRAQLGCAGMTPLWLSYYVDGHRQELHADVPNGPFAFVLSLTLWDGEGGDGGGGGARAFRGGETLVLRPTTLDYWSHYDAGSVVEFRELADLVAPRFGRLTVFDPRLPHGVREVQGTRDPREGRVVLHGWFADPRPCFEGALDEADLEAALNAGLPPLYHALLDADAGMPDVVGGLLVLRIHVQGRDGTVGDVEVTANTLVLAPGQPHDAMADILECVALHVGALAFPAAPDGASPSVVTLPLVFE